MSDFTQWFAATALKDERVVPYELFMLEAWIAAQREARTVPDDIKSVEMRRLLTSSYHALMSYANGNGSPELAVSVAEAIQKSEIALDSVRPPEKYKLMYDKRTKRINKVRQFDGLVIESFDPPADCE